MSLDFNHIPDPPGGKRKALIDHEPHERRVEKKILTLCLAGGLGSAITLFVSNLADWSAWPSIIVAITNLVLATAFSWQHTWRWSAQPVSRIAHCALRTILILVGMVLVAITAVISIGVTLSLLNV